MLRFCCQVQNGESGIPAESGRCRPVFRRPAANRWVVVVVTHKWTASPAAFVRHNAFDQPDAWRESQVASGLEMEV